MRKLFTHIKGLAGAMNSAPAKLSGKAMRDFPVLENAWLMVDGDKFHSFGTMDALPPEIESRATEVHSLEGQWILPAFVDSHTHIVFAKTREAEFEDRIHGLTYEEIAARGGGILNSAGVLRNTSEEDLLQTALKRLSFMMQHGTGAVEIKSGYGLSIEAEIKMLRVIKEIKKLSPIPVKATFLGAHAIPME